jgi:RimJ/RimL family protein N-acetyltransferase
VRSDPNRGPVTLSFPDRIATPRTVLRSWRYGDAAELKAGLDRNATHLVPWIPWATGEAVPLADAESRTRRFADEFADGTNFTWSIRSTDETQLLGGAGLHPRIGPGGVEIGYWIDRDHTGRGLATEVAATLVEVAFSSPEVDRIEIHCDQRNVPSARIPERLGFALARLEPTADAVTLMIWRMLRGEYGHLADGTGAP